MSDSRNPFDPNAITASNIQPGDRVEVKYRFEQSPDWHYSERIAQFTALDLPEIDGDGNRVILVKLPTGHETRVLTSEVGLTGNRYTGEWTAVATKL